MTQELQERLGFQKEGEDFLTKIPFYRHKKNKNLFISQFDDSNNEDLTIKNMWKVMMWDNEVYASFMVSGEMLKDVDFSLKHITETLSKQILRYKKQNK